MFCCNRSPALLFLKHKRTDARTAHDFFFFFLRERRKYCKRTTSFCVVSRGVSLSAAVLSWRRRKGRPAAASQSLRVFFFFFTCEILPLGNCTTSFFVSGAVFYFVYSSRLVHFSFAVTCDSPVVLRGPRLNASLLNPFFFFVLFGSSLFLIPILFWAIRFLPYR